MKITTLCCFTALFFVGSANANLLSNGDFETVDGRVGLMGTALDELGSGWDVYDTLPGGWYVADGSPGIEVQGSTIVDAHSPVNYVELDSHVLGDAQAADTNTSMFQDFIVSNAGHYETQFWYRPRTDINKKDNGIKVYLSSISSPIIKLKQKRSKQDYWKEFSADLGYLDTGSYTIGFQAFGKDNTLGGFLDDISITAVPEPSSLLLLGVGLVGLGFARKKP